VNVSAPPSTQATGSLRKPSLRERAQRLLAVAGPVDPILAAVLVTLISFGIVMVYSASAIEATVQHKDAQYFLKRQVPFGFVGLGLAWLISRIDYRRYQKASATYGILAIVVVLLVAAIAGLGKTGGGATRWLALGPVHVQPAELAKLSIVIWLAYSLAKKGEDVMKSFALGFLPQLIMALFLMALCLKQPDFGSAVVLLLLTFTMMFIAGAKVGYIMGAAIIGSAAGAALVRFREYRWERIQAWLEMEAHRQDLAYQPFQARMSFGSGEIFGLGLGKGLQILYLPEAHTDFVSAVVGEELGFVGIALLCAAYVTLVVRGVRAAFKAPDDFGTYLAFGISTLFALQVLINLAMAMSLLPTKGLALPFMSYGGSSLIVNAIAAGILLNVSRHARDAAPAADPNATPDPPGVEISKRGEATA
jgi:cell division protein FtsW